MVRRSHPGIHQPLVGRRLPAGFTPEFLFERNTLRDKPIEVLHTALAVVVDLGLVGARTERGHQESFHILGRIVETEGLLQPGAAAVYGRAVGLHAGTDGRRPWDFGMLCLDGIS